MTLTIALTQLLRARRRRAAVLALFQLLPNDPGPAPQPHPGHLPRRRLSFTEQ